MRKRVFATHRWLMVIVFVVLLGLVSLALLKPWQPITYPSVLGASTSNQTMWSIQSIDTMKYSRDAARDPSMLARIPALVASIAVLHPTYIAIDTPYDAEFVPVLSAWVQAARNNGLKIWFRGNFSGWEGWFGYAKFSDPTIHHTLTRTFIITHPNLFAAGDIFTPAPEPENGGFGDPRLSSSIRNSFLTFLTTSYTTCREAMAQISRPDVLCGYYSTNGDVARESLTKSVVQQIGNVVVIDHYVADPVQLKNDVVALSNEYGAPVVIGEFGAPIPDINGNMSESQQAAYIQSDLDQLVSIKTLVGGVNYWTAFDSSTEIFNADGSARAVTAVLSRYFNPVVVSGNITDTSGQPAVSVPVQAMNTPSSTITDNNGHYQLTVPAPQPSLLPSVSPTDLSVKQPSKDYPSLKIGGKAPSGAVYDNHVVNLPKIVGSVQQDAQVTQKNASIGEIGRLWAATAYIRFTHWVIKITPQVAHSAAIGMGLLSQTPHWKILQFGWGIMTILFGVGKRTR